MPEKKYGDPELYVSKLEKVMQKLGVAPGDFDFDYSRKGAKIEFTLQGRFWGFNRTVEDTLKADKERLYFGSDVFAQLVLTLEDMARMVKRGIFDPLNMNFAGLKELPPPMKIPQCFQILGFDHVPEDMSDVASQFKELSKKLHPDAGGTNEQFIALKNAYDEALGFWS